MIVKVQLPDRYMSYTGGPQHVSSNKNNAFYWVTLFYSTIAGLIN